MCQGSHSLAGEKDTGLNKSYREENSPTTVLCVCVCVCVCVCELVYTKMFPWKYRWQNVNQIWKQKVDWFLCSGFLGNKINKVQRTTCELQTPCTLGSEKAIAPLSSTLAWTISCMEEPGRLQSMGSLRVRRDWATSLSLFTFHFHALEKEMATHSSTLAWRIPGTGKPRGLPSMGSHRVGHDWSDLAAAAAVP